MVVLARRVRLSFSKTPSSQPRTLGDTIRGRMPHYERIRRVESFDELLRVSFENGINAAHWPRALAGDFAAVAEALQRLGPTDGASMGRFQEDELAALQLSQAGQVAVRTILDDMRALDALGLQPELNCVLAYPRASESATLSTDVYSFHVDRAPLEVDTWLCTYYGSPSEGLRNDQARAHVQIPATRARLLAEFGGEEGEAFEAFLTEHCYDLHYEPTPGATPWSFGVGNLWRVATQWPGSRVPPCVHRAPDEGGSYRLLLIC